MAEQPAVAQPRQRIVVAEPAHVLLQPPALGDVVQLDDEVQRRPVAVAHERHRDDRREGLAGGVEVALVGPVGADLPRQQAPALLAVVARVVGVHDPVEALADQLLGGVAGDVAQRAVDEQPAAVAVEHAGADRRALQTLHVFLKGALGPRREQFRLPARCDVQEPRDTARDAIVHVSHAVGVRLQRPDVDHHAVSASRHPDLARARLARERRAQQRLDRPPQLRRQRAGERTSSATAVRVAEALERLAGGAHEAQLRIEDDDQRVWQLAQRGFGRAIGARQQRVRPRLSRERHGHARVSADRRVS